MSTQVYAKTGPILPAGFYLPGVLAMPDKDNAAAIGARLAQLRKERGITQGELAARLGVSQPMISDYERGELRLHGELILQISTILQVSADEILGLRDERKASAALKNRRLARRLQAIDQLPKRDQEALLRTIDAFLSKAI